MSLCVRDRDWASFVFRSASWTTRHYYPLSHLCDLMILVNKTVFCCLIHKHKNACISARTMHARTQTHNIKLFITSVSWDNSYIYDLLSRAQTDQRRASVQSAGLSECVEKITTTVIKKLKKKRKMISNNIFWCFHGPLI